ncbi:MAG: hypothetical protein J0M25_01245 [Flavobacteriales bacterium]|nr:hypothetical protein [Flavobacteriales bacterium]
MNYLYLYIFLFLPISLFSQDLNKVPNHYKYDSKTIKYLFLDIDGTALTEEEYYKKWRDTSLHVTGWHYIKKDSGYIHRLHNKEFNYFQLEYRSFLNLIEKMTQKKLNDSALILIEYVFKDDLCSNSSTNYYHKTAIEEKKYMSNQYKKFFKKQNKNLYYFVFFEEGIVLQNSKKEDEYYFTDQNNELKNTFFKNETLCGALMITNTDAKAFVRNGEFRPDQMIYYLNPKVWKTIFYED